MERRVTVLTARFDQIEAPPRPCTDGLQISERRCPPLFTVTHHGARQYLFSISTSARVILCVRVPTVLLLRRRHWKQAHGQARYVSIVCGR